MASELNKPPSPNICLICGQGERQEHIILYYRLYNNNLLLLWRLPDAVFNDYGETDGNHPIPEWGFLYYCEKCGEIGLRLKIIEWLRKNIRDLTQQAESVGNSPAAPNNDNA